MNEIKRYCCGNGEGMFEDDKNGHWVEYSEHKAIVEALTEQLRKLLEKLEFAQKELDMLYHFAISNGIAEAGKPPHKVIADYIKQIKQA